MLCSCRVSSSDISLGFQGLIQSLIFMYAYPDKIDLIMVHVKPGNHERLVAFSLADKHLRALEL